MIEYRKHKSGRQFYRVEGNLVLRVINKEKSSLVEIVDSWITVSNATDYDTSKCSESEFKEALTLALERIQKEKIE